MTSTASWPLSAMTSATSHSQRRVGAREVAQPHVLPAGRARCSRAPCAISVPQPFARGGVGEPFLERRRPARLDPERELDEQPGARPLVRIRVEGHVQAFGARVVDEPEQRLRGPGGSGGDRSG